MAYYKTNPVVISAYELMEDIPKINTIRNVVTGLKGDYIIFGGGFGGDILEVLPPDLFREKYTKIVNGSFESRSEIVEAIYMKDEVVQNGSRRDVILSHPQGCYLIDRGDGQVERMTCDLFESTHEKVAVTTLPKLKRDVEVLLKSHTDSMMSL